MEKNTAFSKKGKRIRLKICIAFTLFSTSPTKNAYYSTHTLQIYYFWMLNKYFNII